MKESNFRYIVCASGRLIKQIINKQDKFCFASYYKRCGSNTGIKISFLCCDAVQFGISFM